MSKKNANFYIGSIIILIGILILLSNTHILSGLDDILGGGLLLLIAFVFFTIYNRDRSKWWPLLPATIFAVLGAGVILETFVPFASDLLGAGFMFAIFGVFAFVYTREPAQWWAIIPAGVAFTLGVVILVDTFHVMNSDMSGVVFFLGLGLTFYYLWSLRSDNPNVGWAIWPASVLLILSAIVYIDQADWLGDDYIFPLILVIAGVFLITNGIRKKTK